MKRKEEISSHNIEQFPADLVTLTEELLNGKLHFLCTETCFKPKYEDCISQSQSAYIPNCNMLYGPISG